MSGTFIPADVKMHAGVNVRLDRGVRYLIEADDVAAASRYARERFPDKARQISLNRPVALKTLKSVTPEDIYHLKAEFRVLRDIYHRNLVQLFDLHVQDEYCYLTMELIEGADLITHLNGNWGRGTTDFAALRRVIGQLCDGLDCLHDQQILHRDLKPTNVLVAAEGRTVLLDFGLSITNESTATSMTRSEPDR